jgi:Fe2+ or Zn2+ uptake regulation protein
VSISAIRWAWLQNATPTQQLVLLALADHANEKTAECWPSLTLLERKTKLSRTTIWRTIDTLEKLDLVKRCGQDKSGATKYRLMVGAGNTYQVGAQRTYIDAQRNRVGANCNKVGAQSNVGRCTEHPEPSLNRKNHQEPGRINSNSEHIMEHLSKLRLATSKK